MDVALKYYNSPEFQAKASKIQTELNKQDHKPISSLYGFNTPGVTYGGLACYICKKLICCCNKEQLPDDRDDNYTGIKGDHKVEQQNCEHRISQPPTVIRSNKKVPEKKPGGFQQSFTTYKQELLKPFSMMKPGNKVYQTFVVLTDKNAGNNKGEKSDSSLKANSEVLHRNSVETIMPRSSTMSNESESIMRFRFNKNFKGSETSTSELEDNAARKKR